jgi:hypothetical protein
MVADDCVAASLTPPSWCWWPQVLALDVLRAERAVSTGADRSCRVWKVPEESQLIFK